MILIYVFGVCKIFHMAEKKLLVENDNKVFGTQKGLEARICEIWPGMEGI